MALKLNFKEEDFEKKFCSLIESRQKAVGSVGDLVFGIITDVRDRGDKALVEFTKKFDRRSVENIQQIIVSKDRIRAATADCETELISALETAAGRIEAYHQHQMPDDFDYVDPLGIRLGARWTSIKSVGIYVPGGTAAYPSSVLMNALPARVAGVERIAMVVPAPDNILNPVILAAANIAGIEEIYTIGGAQAVAALAYGTETITAVDKIVGPGNAYVAEAKRQVFGKVGIDMIAGPSEILVVADSDNNPDWIAADLLSQAEHDVNAQSVLICSDENFARAVEEAINKFLLELPRRDIAEKSWREHGAIIVLKSLEDAPELIDRLAPEHLELAVDRADELMKRINHAGAIFLGRYCPEALGDYIAGPSHVLPTSGSAKFSSGLGVFDFLKRSSIIGCGAEGLAAVSSQGEMLALAEGLHAHQLSLKVRSSDNS